MKTPAAAYTAHALAESRHLAPHPMTETPTAGQPVQGTAIQGLRAWLRAWRERRDTGQCCRELLALYHRVADSHPQLLGQELYRRVLASHLGPTGPTVDEVLQGAKDSFASWPADRDIKFRDVVHYLAAVRLMGGSGGDLTVRADIRAVVDEAIPHSL
jgi:hypothetical protein